VVRHRSQNPSGYCFEGHRYFVGGAVIGLEVFQAVAMAAFAGIIDVAQELSRAYLADGEIDPEEINKTFGKISDKSGPKNS
jgi:hypothetical protein